MMRAAFTRTVRPDAGTCAGTVVPRRIAAIATANAAPRRSATRRVDAADAAMVTGTLPRQAGAPRCHNSRMASRTAARVRFRFARQLRLQEATLGLSRELRQGLGLIQAGQGETLRRAENGRPFSGVVMKAAAARVHHRIEDAAQPDGDRIPPLHIVRCEIRRPSARASKRSSAVAPAPARRRAVAAKSTPVGLGLESRHDDREAPLPSRDSRVGGIWQLARPQTASSPTFTSVRQDRHVGLVERVVLGVPPPRVAASACPRPLIRVALGQERIGRERGHAAREERLVGGAHRPEHRRVGLARSPDAITERQ